MFFVTAQPAATLVLPCVISRHALRPAAGEIRLLPPFQTLVFRLRRRCTRSANANRLKNSMM
jgi:hypothetical protein